MSTVTRISLSQNLQKRFGLTGSDSYKIIDIIFDEICESLNHGEEVKITGFGSFKILHKAARIGRNPKTGIPAVISARQIVAFRPCSTVRNKISTK